MKAVFLAAGRGSRLGASDLPKPLWEIGPRGPDDPTPETILGRQIDVLKRCGVKEIAVVVGFRADLVREKLADRGVTFVENTHPDITASGSAHSFSFAARSKFAPLDGKQPCLLFDADLVYERAVLDTILRADESCLLVVPDVGADSEEVRVYGRGSVPVRIGKGIGPPLSDGLELIGEATGIVRFEAQDHALVRAQLDWLLEYGYARIASEHEELAQYLMLSGALGATCCEPGLLFMEADFPEDFERVRAEVYPRILERDGA